MIIILAIASPIIRSRKKKPRPGLYDSALPREGKPVHHTKTIPRRTTSVAPGTHFPVQQTIETPDSDD
jgi:hypothetical protein